MIPLGVLASAVAAGGWAPTDLATLTHWYDAADSAVFTLSGSEVTQWDDKSGGARHLTRVSSVNGPARTGTINGRSVVTFDGSNDGLATTASVVLGTAYTFAMVATKSSGTDDYLMEVASSASQASIITGYGGKAFEFFNVAPSARMDFAASATGHHLLVATRDGTAHATRYDGAPAGSVTASTNQSFTTTGIYLGKSRTTGYAAAQIAELVICTGALTGTDLTDLETYLSDKWGTP